MPDGVSGRAHWPRFEMVHFPEPTGIPHGWDKEMLRNGVPKEFLGLYDAAPTLTLLTVQDDRQFVCFGTSGDDNHLCLDPLTGAVVEIIDVATATPYKSSGVHGSPIFVNSRLDQFIAAVHAVVARFPFEDGVPDQEWDREDGDLITPWAQSANELLETLSRIDPVAMADRRGFWMTFVSDVLIGDYSVESVLNRNG